MIVTYEKLRETIVEVISYSNKALNIPNDYQEKELCVTGGKIKILQNDITFRLQMPLPMANTTWTDDVLELYFILSHKYGAYIDWSQSLAGKEFNHKADSTRTMTDNYLIIVVPKNDRDTSCKSFLKRFDYNYDYITTILKKVNK